MPLILTTLPMIRSIFDHKDICPWKIKIYGGKYQISKDFSKTLASDRFATVFALKFHTLSKTTKIHTNNNNNNLLIF